MAEILVRDLEPELVKQLKSLAKQHGRSLQKEIKLILKESVPLNLSEAAMVSDEWQKQLHGRSFSDSANLIREDRDR